MDTTYLAKLKSEAVEALRTTEDGMVGAYLADRMTSAATLQDAMFAINALKCEGKIRRDDKKRWSLADQSRFLTSTRSKPNQQHKHESPVRLKIIAAIRDGAESRKEIIAELPDTQVYVIDTALSDMVRRGDLVRPKKAHYTVPSHVVGAGQEDIASDISEQETAQVTDETFELSDIAPDNTLPAETDPPIEDDIKFLYDEPEETIEEDDMTSEPEPAIKDVPTFVKNQIPLTAREQAKDRGPEASYSIDVHGLHLSISGDMGPATAAIQGALHELTVYRNSVEAHD